MVIDIDDENQWNLDDFIKICGKCEKVATHFCQTCNDNLCKFCIIDHYKNPDFTKITKWYQFSSWLLIFPSTDTMLCLYQLIVMYLHMISLLNIDTIWTIWLSLSLIWLITAYYLKVPNFKEKCLSQKCLTSRKSA